MWVSSSLSVVTKLFQVTLPKLQLEGFNSNVTRVIHGPVPRVAVLELLCSGAEIVAQPFRATRELLRKGMSLHGADSQSTKSQ